MKHLNGLSQNLLVQVAGSFDFQKNVLSQDNSRPDKGRIQKISSISSAKNIPCGYSLEMPCQGKEIPVRTHKLCSSAKTTAFIFNDHLNYHFIWNYDIYSGFFLGVSGYCWFKGTEFSNITCLWYCLLARNWRSVPWRRSSTPNTPKQLLNLNRVTDMTELHVSQYMKKHHQNGMCAQRRLRSAWASARFDQSLCCALNGYLRA